MEPGKFTSDKHRKMRGSSWGRRTRRLEKRIEPLKDGETHTLWISPSLQMLIWIAAFFFFFLIIWTKLSAAFKDNWWYISITVCVLRLVEHTLHLRLSFKELYVCFQRQYQSPPAMFTWFTRWLWKRLGSAVVSLTGKWVCDIISFWPDSPFLSTSDSRLVSQINLRLCRRSVRRCSLTVD